MNASFLLRRSLPGTAALLLLAAPAIAADPAAAENGENVQQQLEEAQKRLDETVREVERLSARLGAQVGDRFIRGPMMAPRAILGVQVGPDDAKRGAAVVAVSPGGPAEAAGLKPGDVIVSVAGKDISRAGDPGRELLEVMRGQEPEGKVTVRYLRDGKTRDADITPRAAPRVFAFRGGPPGRGGFDLRLPDPRGPDTDGGDAGRGRVPLAGMELATLSEKLGGYFGAKAGVLVVRAGNNDAFKLQDGDVILKIDGREPSTASHATRILRSYQRGEKLQMTILRDRRTQTLDVTLPDG